MALQVLDPENTSTPTSQATTPVVTGKALAGKNSAYGLPIAGAPTSIEPGLLENMQRLINEREAQKNSMASALQYASAWGSGGVQGPGAMLLQQQKQREEEDATTFGMKSQLSQARMAQQLAQNDADFVKNALGGGGGGFGAATGTAGAQYSPEAIAAARNEQNPTKARAILQEDLKSRGAARNKGMFEAAGNKPEKYFWPGGIGEVTMTPNMLINLPPEIRKQIEEATLKMFGTVPTGAAPTGAAPTGAGGVNAANIEKVESGGNPNAVSPKGAQGAMQVMPNTQRDPGFGVRPAADNSPQELTRVGQDYYGAMQKRYGHDTLAAIAYNMGPGKTDEWLKAGGDFNKLPAETQAYIGKVNLANAMQNRQVATAPATAVDLAKPMPDNFPVVAGEEKLASQRFTPPAPITAPTPISAPAPAAPAPAPAPVAAPAPAAPKIAVPEFNEPAPKSKDFQSQGAYETAKQTWERRRDAAIKIQEEIMAAEGKVPAEATKEFALKSEALNAAKAAKIDSSGLTAPERSIRFNDVIAITEDPKMKEIFGKLAKKGLTPFVLKQLESGINAGQFGTIGIAGLERNLMEAGATPTQIEQLRRVEKHLAQAELEYAQAYLTGQGAVSDNERRLVKEATGNIKDPPRVLAIQAKVMAQRADFDSKIYEAYSNYRDTQGEYASLPKFMRSAEGRRIINEHNTNLARILGRSPSELNDPIKAGAVPQASQHPGAALVNQYVPAKKR
jgi:hypothetical protein